MKYTLLLFYRDLRLEDNLALKAAMDSGLPVLALYVLEGPLGEAQRSWLFSSLASLERSLATYSISLNFTFLSFEESIKRLTKEHGKPEQVFYNDSYDREAARREELLKAADVNFQAFPGMLVILPEELKTKSGSPYKVFTAFFKAALKKEASYNGLNRSLRKVLSLELSFKEAIPALRAEGPSYRCT